MLIIPRGRAPDRAAVARARPPAAMTITASLTEHDAAQREALAERVFGAALGAMDLLSIYLGDRLGLYRGAGGRGRAPRRRAGRRGRASTSATSASGWSSRPSPASSPSTTDAAGPDERRYRCRRPRRGAADRDSLAFGAARSARIGGRWPRCHGARWTPSAAAAACPGPPTAPTPARRRPTLNRPCSSTCSARSGCRRCPTSTRGCRAAGGARRGPRLRRPAGRASPSPAPTRTCASTASTSTRRRSSSRAPHAAAAGARRPGAASTSATRPDPARWRGRYDLVHAFEAVHDMAHPVEALATMRALAAPGGAVLVMDERAANVHRARRRRRAPLLRLERPLLPAVGHGGAPSAAHRHRDAPGDVRGYAREAGFADVEVLPSSTLLPLLPAALRAAPGRAARPSRPPCAPAPAAAAPPTPRSVAAP